MSAVHLRYPLHLQLIARDVILQTRPARSGRLRKPMKRLVELPQVIQLLGQGVSDKELALILKTRTGQEQAQLCDMIGIARLNAQLRAKQIARIPPRLHGNRAVARGFSLRKSSETALTAGEVVPKPGSLRLELCGAPIEAVGALMCS